MPNATDVTVDVCRCSRLAGALWWPAVTAPCYSAEHHRGPGTRIRPSVMSPEAFGIPGMTRNIVIVSMGIAGLMALASLLDMIVGKPFEGQVVFDVLFLLASGLIVYMGIDCLKHA